MDREFLENQGLETKVINEVMKEYGKAINPLKEEKQSLETERDQLNEQVDTYKNQLSDLSKNSNDDDLKQQISDLQEENEGLKETHDNDLAEQQRQHKIELAVANLGTKDNEYIASKLGDLELKDGELVGFDKKVDELKEKHPVLFDEEPQKKKPGKWAQGSFSGGNGGALTREEIMKETDATKRQQMIRENAHLFK